MVRAHVRLRDESISSPAAFLRAFHQFYRAHGKFADMADAPCPTCKNRQLRVPQVAIQSTDGEVRHVRSRLDRDPQSSQGTIEFRCDLDDERLLHPQPYDSGTTKVRKYSGTPDGTRQSRRHGGHGMQRDTEFLRPLGRAVPNELQRKVESLGWDPADRWQPLPRRCDYRIDEVAQPVRQVDRNEETHDPRR